jgi:glycosyltransferase involved in cell wall biosynthesis
MISVIISTRNRPSHIQTCLKSILNNTFQKFEILLVDQSNDNQTKLIVKQLRSNKIRFFKSNRKGKTVDLNSMIRVAKYNILSFTDDDCIVDKNWLQEIYDSYIKYPNTAGVFGNTYPYKPQNHPNEMCPAIFIAKKTKSYQNHALLNHLFLGPGNNMSLQKSAIIKAKYFKEWLGTGSIAWAGEETDLIFRILIRKYILMTNPKMVVYHNRWLTKFQLMILSGAYSCGMIAFYSYYLFNANNIKVTKLIKKRFITYIYQPLSDYFVTACHFRLRQLFYKKMELLSGLWELYCFLRGFILGAIFGIKDLFV